MASYDVRTTLMNEAQFLTHVRERADLESTDQARAATEATLQVLGARITEPEAEDLAAQLPEELAKDLTWQSPSEADAFDSRAFVDRVSEREGDDPRLDDVGAESHAEAVASVVTDAVGSEELADVRAQLPDGYDRLFDPS